MLGFTMFLHAIEQSTFYPSLWGLQTRHGTNIEVPKNMQYNVDITH